MDSLGLGYNILSISNRTNRIYSASQCIQTSEKLIVAVAMHTHPLWPAIPPWWLQNIIYIFRFWLSFHSWSRWWLTRHRWSRNRNPFLRVISTITFKFQKNFLSSVKLGILTDTLYFRINSWMSPQNNSKF